MATTLAKFPGQFPQTSQFPTNLANIAALYLFESDGSTSVGSDNLTASVSGGSINHNSYGVHGKCANIICSSPTSEFGGSSYRKTSNASSWNWSSSGKTYIIWHKHQTNCTHAQWLWYFKRSGGDGSLGVYYNSATGQYSASMWNDGNSVNISFGSNVNWVNGADGAWHQIAFVTESATAHKLYVDGILHDSSTTSMTISANGFVSIGDIDSTFGMSGFVDEMTVISRALTAKEIYNYGGAIL